jgi:hypothetical protein
VQNYKKEEEFQGRGFLVNNNRIGGKKLDFSRNEENNALEEPGAHGVGLQASFSTKKHEIFAFFDQSKSGGEYALENRISVSIRVWIFREIFGFLQCAYPR